MNLDEKNKQVQNLFRALQNNPKSIFYTATKLTKSLIKKKQKQQLMIEIKFL